MKPPNCGTTFVPEPLGVYLPLFHAVTVMAATRLTRPPTNRYALALLGRLPRLPRLPSR